jgi:GNAT superfamily N-acetyltransferase
MRRMDGLSISPMSVASFRTHHASGELLRGYAAECAIANLPEPSPDWAAYEQMESAGAMTLLAARRGELLIGVCTVVMYRNPHYSQPMGVTESLFVTPEFRSTGAGMGLLRAAERIAKAAGAMCLFVSAPTSSALSRVLASHQSYKWTNLAFMRRFA